MKKLVLLLVSALNIVGCSKLDKTTDDDSAAYAFESAIGSINSAANDSEQSSSYAMNSSVLDILLPKAYAASCGVNRFTPMIGSANCLGTENNKTILSNFDNCTVGDYDQFSMNGEVKLSFDTSATCDSWIDGGSLPTSGYLVRTSSSLIRSNLNGSYVKTSSDESLNYLGQSIGGGVKTRFTNTGRTFDILGLHRTRTRANGDAGFDHSVYSTSPIVVTGSRLLGNRQIVSGTVRVDHNKAKYSVSASMSGLVWDNTCCHPVGGTISFNMSGSVSGTYVLDFSTGSCGKVNMTNNLGTQSQVEISTCE